jgi:hypothetical protein
MGFSTGLIRRDAQQGERAMIVGTDQSIVDSLNRLSRVLAEALEVLLTVKLSVAEQTNRAGTGQDLDESDELMRLKDDGCPNGE